ncbi:MAG: hypothetical protein GF421_00920 [Candidatus Aminicenantes bacterium]|nr:hypothetical protein [Candidatus Aminicenantes bacterium]
MGLEEILKKISDQGDEEAQKIIEKSKEQARQIKEKAEQEAAVEAEQYMAIQRNQAEMESTRIMTQARLDRKMKILFYKKQVIDEVLDKAFQQAFKGKKELKKTVVMKQGQKQSTLDEQRIKDELRPALEGQIAEDLKL